MAELEGILDIISGALMLAGAGFAFIAALGVFRFPDVYIRMHAATKAGTLGAALIFVAVALQALSLPVTVRVLAALIFLFLTAPVGSHLLARAAYMSRIRLWDRSVRDDLFGRFDLENRRLRGFQKGE